MDTIVSVTPMMAGSYTTKYKVVGDEGWPIEASAIVVTLLRDDVILAEDAGASMAASNDKPFIKVKQELLNECTHHLEPDMHTISPDGKTLTVYYKDKGPRTMADRMHLLGNARLRLCDRMDIALARLFPSARDHVYQLLGALSPEVLPELKEYLDKIPNENLSGVTLEILTRTKDLIIAEALASTTDDVAVPA